MDLSFSHCAGLLLATDAKLTYLLNKYNLCVLQGFEYNLAEIFQSLALPRYLAICLPRVTDWIVGGRHFEEFDRVRFSQTTPPLQWTDNCSFPDALYSKYYKDLQGMFVYSRSVFDIDVSSLFVYRPEVDPCAEPSAKVLCVDIVSETRIELAKCFCLSDVATGLSIAIIPPGSAWPPAVLTGDGALPQPMAMDEPDNVRSGPPNGLPIIDPGTCHRSIWLPCPPLKL